MTLLEDNISKDGATRRRRLRLPGTALAFIYIVFCSSALLLAIGRAVAPFDAWEKAAAALGLVGLAAMAVQFVTSGRFEAVSGRLGIDKIMAFHKQAAIWVLLALVLHPLLYAVPTFIDHPALGVERMLTYLTLPHYRSGVVALGALLLLITSSILRDRLPWPYEAWRLSHVLLALVAVIGGLHHAVSVGRYSMHGTLNSYWLALGIGVVAVILVLHGWRWWKLHGHPWRLEGVTQRADRMWELDIQPEPKTPPRHYHAGQFVWMTEGARRAPIFDHPFSIADSPKRPGFSLIIKEAGDFTRTIGTIPPGTPIGIDGPYGEFTLESHDCDAVLLLAGGVGIAPIMGLLRDLAASGDTRPVRLAYAAGIPENFACLEEIEATKSALDLRTLYLSEENGPDWRGLVGRLDQARLDDLLDGLDRKRTVAFICGPGPMVTGVSDTLLDLGLPMANIVYERFDYGGGAASRQDRRRTLGFLSIGAGLAVATLLFVAAA